MTCDISGCNENQGMTCDISGCKFDEAYAVIDDKKLYRVTFSASLADIIAKQTGKAVKKVKLKMGRTLEPGEQSSSGLYAICKVGSGWPLRVSLFKQAMELWQDSSRVMKECWLTNV